MDTHAICDLQRVINQQI